MNSIILSDDHRFQYPITSDFKVAKSRMERILSRLMEGYWAQEKPFIFFGTGTSGAMCLVLIQTIFSDAKVCLLNTSDSHHRSPFEYSNGFVSLSDLSDHTLVFVDDLIATGSTLNRCREMLKLDKFDIIATLFESCKPDYLKSNCDTFISFSRYKELSNP